MTLVERNKIDNIIKQYLLLDIRIKILKAKIKHYAYNNKIKLLKRHENILIQLEQLKTNIESNIDNKYLEYIKVFKMDTDEAMQEFNINKNNLFKLKKDIRNEFIKVIDIVEAEQLLFILKLRW